MHMIYAHRPLNYLYSLIPAQPLHYYKQLLSDFTVQDFSPILRYEHYMISAIPLSVGHAHI